MFKNVLGILSFFCYSCLFGQDYFPKNDGVKTENKNFTAFTNAKIFVTPTEVINNGTLLIQNGAIVAVGAIGSVRMSI